MTGQFHSAQVLSSYRGLGRRHRGTHRVGEFDGTEPLKGGFSASLLADVDLLYEAQTGQDVSDVIETTHFS